MNDNNDEDNGILATLTRLFILGLSYLLAIPFFVFYIRVVNEYERGVVFRMGRILGAKGPGMFFLLPLVDRMIKVDLRTVTLDVPAQECISKDSVTVKVNAVVYFTVVDPIKTVSSVQSYVTATNYLAQTTLRAVIGTVELDEMLSNREELGGRMKAILDKETHPWGVSVRSVEVKDVQLPVVMQRAMASQAEAERERKAKVIAADGEFQSAFKLAEAATVISSEPATMQLRYLQTLHEVSESSPSTLYFPLPVDMLSQFDH